MNILSDILNSGIVSDMMVFFAIMLIATMACTNWFLTETSLSQVGVDSLRFGLILFTTFVVAGLFSSSQKSNNFQLTCLFVGVGFLVISTACTLIEEQRQCNSVPGPKVW